MDISPFINNAALLLALSIVSTYLRYRWVREFRHKEIVIGILYGMFTIITMSMPMRFPEGVIFDGRSIIISLAALFESPLVALIASALGIAYRIYLGGGGMLTGVGSILISLLIGLGFRKLTERGRLKITPWSLLLLGFVVHLMLDIWFLTLPKAVLAEFYRTTAIPYLVIFSITTMLIGMFIQGQVERMAGERNLAESERKYRALVETMLEGIWVVDRDAKTTFVNPALTQMEGYSEEEMLGKSLDLVLDKENLKKAQKFFERRRQGYADRYELVHTRKDGKKIPVLVTSAPLFDKYGEFQGALAAITDISDRKKAEQELARYSKNLEAMVMERTADLRAAQEQLLRTERMATLGELAGSVGHELRNPLSVIRNATYLLKAAKGNETRQNEYTRLIEQETQNATNIINDLLDYSRIQPQKPIACHAADLVSDALAHSTIPAGIKMEVDISRELPEALANPQQISQILINLVSNACEAMPEGGSLKINAAHEGNRVVIQVTDSGKGIAKDDLPRLFEPLFTTKPRGVGLGLAISKRLADLNHAEISASSQKGKGAVFTLSLPTA